jgi:hypothetical protein
VRGEKIDAKDVRKHGNDIIRLSQLLTPATRITLAREIASDLNRFLHDVVADGSHDPKALQIDLALSEIVARLRQAYSFRGAN